MAKDQVCKFYLEEGICKKGAQCEFRHTSPKSPTPKNKAAPPKATSKAKAKQVCQYFQKGKCTFGTKCPRAHITNSEAGGTSTSRSSNISESPLSPRVITPEAVANGSEAEGAKKSEGAHEKASVAPTSTNSKSPPRVAVKSPCYFYTIGQCSNLDECQFAHGEPEVKEEETPKDEVCEFYPKGTCRRGANCGFLHLENPPAASLATPNNLSFPDSPAGKDEDEGENEQEQDVAPTHYDNESASDHSEKDITEGFKDVSTSHPPQGTDEDVLYADEDDDAQGDEEPERPLVPISRRLSGHSAQDRDVEATSYPYSSPDRYEQQPPNTHPIQTTQPTYNSTNGYDTSPTSQDQVNGHNNRQYPQTNGYVNGFPASQPISTPVPPSMPGYPHVSEVVPHWSQFADPHAQADLPFCKALAQGACQNGESCRFRHSVTPEEYFLLFRDQQPNLWTLHRDPSQAQSQPQPQPQYAPFMIQPTYAPPSFPSLNSVPAAMSAPVPIQTLVAPPPLPQPQLTQGSAFRSECKFYKIGTCRNGDLCPYTHTKSASDISPNSPNPNSREQDTWGNPSDDMAKRKIKKPCRFFNSKQGHCLLDDKCPYQHILADKFSEGAHSITDGGNQDEQVVEEGWGNGGNASNQDDGWGNNAGKAAADDGWGSSANDGWGPPVAQQDRGYSRSRNSDTWSSSGPRDGKICYAFQNGYCRHGERCKFSHQLNNRSNGSRRSNSERDSGKSYGGGQGLRGTWSAEHVDTKPGWGDEAAADAESVWPPPAAPGDGWGNSIAGHDTAPVDDGWPPPSDNGWPSRPSAKSEPTTTGSKVTKETTINEEEVEETPPQDDETRPSTPHDQGPFNNGNDDEPQLDESEHEPELEPIVFEHPAVKKRVLNTSVLVGPDFCPETVETCAESRQMLLSNFPPETGIEDVEKLVIPLDGTIKGDGHATDHMRTHNIDFKDSRAAQRAFEKLHRLEHTFGGRQLVATLKGLASVTLRLPQEMTVLQLTWPNATRSAWIYYKTIDAAKAEAARLDASIIRGRNVKTAFEKPQKKQKDNFAVRLSQLHPHTTRADVEAVCKGTTHCKMEGPTYEEDPVTWIMEELNLFGANDVEHIEPTVSETTSSMLATFKTESVARLACKELDAVEQPRLGKQTITARLIHRAKFKVSREVFDVVQKEINNMRDRGTEEKTFCLQYHEFAPGSSSIVVDLNATASNYATFAAVSKDALSMLGGLLLRNDEGVVWEDYFETSSSVNALKQAQQKTNTFIYRDDRTETIRIFGSNANQTAARIALYKLISKVQALRTELDVPRQAMRQLVDEKFNDIQEDIGANKVSFDVFRSKLIVRGSPEDLSKAKGSLAKLAASSSTPQYQRGNCEICHHDPVDPIFLSCRHAYCKTCIQMAIRNAKCAPLCCVAAHRSRSGENTPCSATVPYVIIHDLLTPTEEIQFFKASMLAYVRQRPEELFICPSMNCGSVYRVGKEGLNVHCPFCQVELCTHCKTFAHIGHGCEDARKWLT